MCTSKRCFSQEEWRICDKTRFFLESANQLPTLPYCLEREKTFTEKMKRKIDLYGRSSCPRRECQRVCRLGETTMPRTKKDPPAQLEDMPNIGKAIAAHLRCIGIVRPDQLARREPIAIYRELSKVLGHRLDPCVLYTLLSVKHFLDGGEALPWWNFTAEGKIILKLSDKGSQP